MSSRLDEDFWSSFLIVGLLPSLAMVGNGWYHQAIEYVLVIFSIGCYARIPEEASKCSQKKYQWFLKLPPSIRACSFCGKLWRVVEEKSKVTHGVMEPSCKCVKEKISMCVG